MFTMHLGCVVEVDSGVSVVGWVRFYKGVILASNGSTGVLFVQD